MNAHADPTPRPRRPHVVYLGHSAALSGAEIALLRLIEAYPDHRATVVLAEDGPLVPRLTAAGARVIVLPLPNAAGIRRTDVTGRRLPLGALTGSIVYSVRIAGLLRRLCPDAVHTNSMKAHLYGGVAARLASVPQVWHARDRAATDYMPGTAVRLVRIAARVLPAALIANSHATLSTYPGARNPAVVHDAAPRHIRRQPRSTAPLQVGMVGRLAPWKGQDVFLRAFASAFPDGDQRAVLVGDALFGEQDHVASLVELTDTLGIADRVTFTGFTDDVPAQLDVLHVLVHCSLVPEPFGQVVVEGMAAGLPVVAADSGGPAEVIDHDHTGLLTPPGDVASLATALERLADDDELRARLGHAAEVASMRFRPEATSRQIAAVHQVVAYGSTTTSAPRVPIDGPAATDRPGQATPVSEVTS